MENKQIYDHEIESNVLGAIISEPVVFDKIAPNWDESVFHKPKHKTIAWAIDSLYKDNKQIDLLTVKNFLQSHKKLDDIGGIYELTQLTTSFAGTYRTIEHYYSLREMSMLRKLSATGLELNIASNEPGADPFDVQSKFSQRIESVTANLNALSVNTIGTLSKENIKRLYDINSGKIKPGVYTGFECLQEAFGGWQKSDLIILAARPAMGKTALSIQFFLKPAIKFNIPTAFFSLEMNKTQIISRAQSILTDFGAENILKGNLTENEIKSLELSTSHLSTRPIFIDDTPALSIYEFRNRARRLKKEEGVQIFIIDYLQLMRASVTKGNREQEISYISRSLKEIAKELDTPIIALSQLSRDLEKRATASKRPLLSDLRESGAIEQDADMVLFIYRPEYYGLDSFEDDTSARGVAEIICAKNRHGRIGYVRMGFNQSHVRFHDFNEPQTIAPVTQNSLQPNNDFTDEKGCF